MTDRLYSWLHYNLAQVFAFFKLYDRAIAELHLVLAADRDDARAWRSMGFLQALLTKRLAAVEAFNEALRIEPGHDATRFNLGYLLHELKRHPEAIIEFRKVVATSPKNDRAWYGLGLCLEETGNLDEAIEALKQASTLQYFNPHAGFHLALLYHRTRQPEQALAEYERILSFDPKCAAQIRQATGITPQP